MTSDNLEPPGADQLDLLDRTLSADELDDLISPDASPSEVTFSSQDFDAAGLVRRLRSESMLIPRLGGTDARVATAGFQRGFVWSKAQMDRFIESLLLGYPVPGIFLVKQAQDNRLLVLDGQQRLLTLVAYFVGEHRGKPFALSNVSEEFQGLTYHNLPEALRFRLDDSYMQATIVVADGTPEVSDAIYQLFERLNSGGTQLTPHEIRVALAAGPLIDYLEALNGDPNWRGLFGTPSRRIRDQELILRIVALYLDASAYSRPQKTFLNGFARKHRQLSSEVEAAGVLFRRACEALASNTGADAFRRPGASQVNMAQTEAVVVGLMHAIAVGKAPLADLSRRISVLKADSQFTAATTRATADNDSVSLRLSMARRALTSS
jgi:hypothetical protein